MSVSSSAADLRLPRVTSPGSSHATSTSSFADTVNPFLAPTADLFQLKQAEQAAKQAAKEANSSLRIWDKSNPKPASTSPSGAASSSLTSPHSAASSSSYVQRVQARNAFLASSSHSHSSTSSSPADLLRANVDKHFYPSRLHHLDKLNMSTFIAQKRDMFLLHMSLTTKRREIDKLEEKAAMKEEALRKSELMLEEDAMRFDAFLKENDRKAHESLKRADRESKEKNERIVEIKKLNAEIGKVESEMGKYEEQLVNCIRYKQFLDGLTEPEWLAKEERRKEEKRSARRKRREEAAKTARLRARDGAAGAGRAGDGSMLSARARSAQSGAQTSRVTWRQRADEEKEALSAAEGGAGGEASEGAQSLDDEDCDDEEAMYFTAPQQLLDLFSQLEERNLFLIQNVQETEEAVEEMRARYADMEADMDAKQAVLQQNIDEMNRKIEKEREKTDALRVRKELMGIVGDVQGVDAERVVDGLREQVRAVYRKCGFDADTQTDTLDMLRDVEGWLEHLLDEMKAMDPAKVEQAEKRKNAERRTMIRQAKKEEQKRMVRLTLAATAARSHSPLTAASAHASPLAVAALRVAVCVQYAERLAKSTARATAEVVRLSGKPVMFRSAPLRRKVKEENVQQVDEEAEEIKRYFT